MSDKQNHVDAIFAGVPVRFELCRDRRTMTRLEALQVRPYELLQRFASGTWDANDILLPLSLAFPVHPYAWVRAVEDVLEQRPHGLYAPLVVLVLEAHLFGITPERGQFDERGAA